MERRCRILMVVAVLMWVAAGTPGSAQVASFNLGVWGTDGLGPQLELKAQSVPVGTTWAPDDGLWTYDMKRQTTGRVLPNAWGDARGRISGVATVLVYEGGNPVMGMEVPVKGRSRITARTVSRAVDPTTRGEPVARVAIYSRTVVAANLSIRGRAVHPDSRQPFAFNMLAVARKTAEGSGAYRGSSMSLGMPLFGRLNIIVPRHQVGRSHIVIEDENVGLTLWYAIEDGSMVLDPARGIFRAEAIVGSESLGVLPGGTVRAKFNWYRPETNRAGRYSMNGVRPPFRFTTAGYTLTTLEQASVPGAALTDWMEMARTKSTLLISSAPGALNSWRLVGFPPTAMVP